MDIKMSRSDFIPKPDEEDPVLMLLDLMNVRETDPLSQLADFLVRLDNLSHCLVWTKDVYATPGSPVSIDIIEIPRVNLTLRGVPTGSGVLRLECVDHVGLYVSNYRDYKVEQMLDRLSCSVLLQDDHHRLSILLPTSLQK